jgi:glyoxylase-like metal-dependent hydrolase (beta-lactamase superfamily II)
MGLEVKAIHIGDVMLDWSRLLLDFQPGRKTWVPCNCFLILGAETPILVDTGFGSERDMQVYGMKGSEIPEQDLILQLRGYGVKPEDVGYIIHTHLHVDHCGKNQFFPNARVVVQRKEIGYGAGELKPYHCPYISWFINNLNRMEFLDGDAELLPGVKCVQTIAHTGGHQDVEVQTKAGKAIMCGDNVYDIPMQLEGKHPSGRIWATGYYYHQELLLKELYKYKKEKERGTMILPTHSYEVYDVYKLGNRLGDKKRNYVGFPSYDWPPKE